MDVSYNTNYIHIKGYIPTAVVFALRWQYRVYIYIYIYIYIKNHIYKYIPTQNLLRCLSQRVQNRLVEYRLNSFNPGFLQLQVLNVS